MSRAFEYRQIAGELEQLAAEVQAWWDAHALEMDAVVFVGPARVPADRGRAAGAAAVQAAVTEIRRQISEARYRAEVCDRFTNAMQSFLNCVDGSMTAPVKIASWVMEG